MSGPLAAFAPVAVLFKPFKNEDLLAAIGRAGARIETPGTAEQSHEKEDRPRCGARRRRGGDRGVHRPDHRRRKGRPAAARLGRLRRAARVDGHPAGAAEVRRRDQAGREGIESLVAAGGRAAQGRAQRAAHHDRRRRLRRPEHVRRRHPDARARPDRAGRAALHALPHHRALLADARGPPHRAQPPLGGLRRDLGDVHRLPRLRQHHRPGLGDDRPDPGRQRLRHLVVRQEPQHARVPGEPGRPVRPVADRHGLRVLLRLRRRRHEPVAAQPLPRHRPDLPLRRQPEVEPDHRDGGRRDRAHQAAERDDARQAVLRPLHARRHARAAPPDAGVDREVQGQVLDGLEPARASRSSPTRRSSA